MATDLKNKKCVPCEGDVDILNSEEIATFAGNIHDDWVVISDKKIKRTFNFVNFKQTMDFVNRIADIAEEEGHHPDLQVSYGKCVVEIWTHAINGLSENDFILAAKIDEL